MTEGEAGPIDLEQLYRDEYEGSVHLARLLVGDRHRAEELAQEAFVRVAPAIGGLEDPAPYLRRVLVNLCRDHQRRQRTVRRHPDPPAAPVPGPSLPAEMAEVWQAVQRLPERRRTAIVLRFWADRPTEEIAQVLGCRPATVRSLIHRGLASLEEVLTDDR
ncbi:MAG TPA: SigE family RNA polymerase sigma factor [Iamia sp.]|nr:SigE family RNA polymerase sigma factor [Iamia sp.]